MTPELIVRGTAVTAEIATARAGELGHEQPSRYVESVVSVSHLNCNDGSCPLAHRATRH